PRASPRSRLGAMSLPSQPSSRSPSSSVSFGSRPSPPFRRNQSMPAMRATGRNRHACRVMRSPTTLTSTSTASTWVSLTRTPAIAAAPTLAADPFWTSPDGTPGAIDGILEQARAVATPIARLQIDLVAGHLDRAQHDLDTDAPIDPTLAALLIPAWQGDPTAWA